MVNYKNPFEPGGAFYNPQITDASRVIEPRIMPGWVAKKNNQRNDGFVKDFLQKIRNANKNHISTLDMNWTYYKSICFDDNVQIYKNKSFRVAVGVNGTAIKKIKPLMTDVNVEIHNNPTFKDVLKYAFNMFGDYFEIKDYSGVNKMRIFHFLEPFTERYIFVSCKEEYSNILGNYLFGKEWDIQHLENDRSWVLHIHSPWFSKKFLEAQNDLLEQRRLMYLALGQEVDNADDKVLKQFKYIAKLTANIAAKKTGLTIYTYKWDTDNNIIPNPIPLEYSPYNDIEYEDAKYPVDVKLWDGNNTPALGNNFYKDYEFKKGKYTQVTVGASVQVPGGMGRLKGYIKGFGYCEFVYLNYAGVACSLDFGTEIGTGIIEGKYNYELKGLPNPLSFAGPGSNTSYSANDFNGKIVIELSNWEGYNKDGDMLWNGKSFGFELEATIGISLPGEKEEVKTYTKLTFPELGEKSYTNLNAKPYKEDEKQ